MLVAGLLLLAAGSAAAEDAWDDPYPGMRYLKRREQDQLYHIVKVRLDNPFFAIRATKPDEKGQTTTSFARRVNAAVAVNGDWFDPRTRTPRGLAVGDGVHWPETKDDKDHSFIACDSERRCEIDPPKTTRPQIDAWKNVVGGDGSLLVQDGKPRSEKADAACGSRCTRGRPRTAVGLDRGRGVLFLLVAEGARPGVRGPTLRQVALVLHGLGAHNAVSFEGGPSSTMVIGNRRVNELPKGHPEEQAVSNHFAVVYNAPEDHCTLAQRVACSKYGCACIDGKCNGGFCEGDGCTEAMRRGCEHYGCPCVDMRCSGGYCPGPGCTANAARKCRKRGCHCVDGKCVGGKCPGIGCTANRATNCTKLGCLCVSGECSGGSCPGNGCEEKRTRECRARGCGCVDGECSGGQCPGTGCTARQTEDCQHKGCGCVEGKCAGGKCPGATCTETQIMFCSARNCGCAEGKCTGENCFKAGCAGCACALGRKPTHPGVLWLISILLVAVAFLRRTRRA